MNQEAVLTFHRDDGGYYHIAEATNEHDYTKQGNCEKWSSSSYEK